MQNGLTFNGFNELIQLPLEKSDPRSFELIENIFADVIHLPADPFRFLLSRFVNKKFKGQEAKEHWRSIMHHKADMEKKLGRRIGIHVAIHDYFDGNSSVGHRSASTRALPSSRDFFANTMSNEDPIAALCSHGNHLDNFKKELFRAKRYKHSLSVIMLDVDGFQMHDPSFSNKSGEELLTVIVKIIKKTIRIVDILSQYSDCRFLIVLPNTNKREAVELSERIRQNICERTKRIFGLSGVTATLSVGQTTSTSASIEFMNQLETVLEEGKKKNCNNVYSL